MSPTSSDAGASSPGATSTAAESAAHARVAAASHRLRLQRDRRRFERAFWVLVAGLGAVSAVFLLLGALQGPKLSSAIVDPQRVVEQPGQQLRLFANQPLAEVTVEQVTVTPAAAVTTLVQDDVLIVQFEQPLRAGTEYTVEVTEVGALSRDATSTFTHRFTTAGSTLLYLDRGETVDEVLRAPLDGTGRGEVVHAAEGIQHIAPVEGLLVVARDAPDGTSVLELVAPDGAVQTLSLPEGAQIERLVPSPIGTLLAMILLVPDPAQEGARVEALAAIDLGTDTAVEPVLGLDGVPVRATSAEFLPDARTLIVHAFDTSLLRVELADPPLALPFGQVPTMYAVSTDGTRVTGGDGFGEVVIDVATGTEDRLVPSLVNGQLAFGGEVRLTRGELRVQKVAVPDETGGTIVSLLIADEGAGEARVLFRTVDDRGSIGDFVLSPNDQYVAVEVTPSVTDAQPDGRPVNGRPTSVTTVVIDIATGAVVRTLEGFAPHF